MKVRGLAIAAITALSGLSLIGLTQSSGAAVTIPAKPYDFNGDGYVDTAIGSPYGKVGTVTSAGFVNVMYGSSAGLNTGKKQVISQALSWVPGAAEASDHFAYALASGDFDKDGYADLAVGTPDEDTSSGANAGYITLLWGSSSGLSAATDGVEFGTPGAGHRWGESLAAGDIEGDGGSELFITVPGDAYTSAFKWLYFNELTPATARTKAATRSRNAHLGGSAPLRTAKKGEVTTLSATDVNSSWVGSGDVTGDGKADLFYGWYDADSPEPADQRGFYVFPGVIPEGEALGDLGTPAVVLDHVAAVAIGDFDGDTFGDVAVGQPADSVALGGQVKVYKGGVGNVTADNAYVLNQDSPGVPGGGEAGDAFGASIAAGDVNKDGKADLAVGSPTEDIGGRTDDGAADVLYGSASGLTGTGSQQVTQNTTGVPGGAESGDKFGTQVTLLDNSKNGFVDLSAGAPTENVSDGMVSWLPGTASGVTGTGSIGVTSTHFGVIGKRAEIGRRLGRAG